MIGFSSVNTRPTSASARLLRNGLLLLTALLPSATRDSGARSLYSPADVFFTRKVEHYAGLGVEWWFNSSSYP